MRWFSTRKEKELEERLERVERAFKGLQLEWDETYDALRKLTQRYTKRAEQIEKHDAQEQPENGSATGSTTATLDPVSKRILDRRHRVMHVREDIT